MPKEANSNFPTPITATRHADKRPNIPTEELRDFVTEEEIAPKTILYPRPSLDPQLVWKGKDEQDQHPLEVPAVPVCIQEKNSPQAIIENVSIQAKKEQPEPQMALFNDFNNFEFEDLVNFYHHEQIWSNRMILGDSLLVMTSLAEKEALKGKVQMIYMELPYGIKFGSNWQVSTRKRNVKDGKADDLTRQPEQIKTFRDTWELGIRSYLAYLRDRLTVARDLLSDSGSVFVQIGDENVHLVRCVMDEVFGSENFINQIGFRTAMTKPTDRLNNIFDCVLWYGESEELLKYRPLLVKREFVDENEIIGTQQIEASAPQAIFRFTYNGKSYNPINGWRVTEKSLRQLDESSRLHASGTLRFIRYAKDFPYVQCDNICNTQLFEQSNSYVVQTSTDVIARCILMTTDPGDLVLDPTCGSGITAYVAEQWGRRWITIDTSRVAIALARTRLMAGCYPYYLLSDSPEGQAKEAEITGHLPASPLPLTSNDIRCGFLYKRVPCLTLKSIANNEKIDTIHEKWQPQLEVLREQINTLTGKHWQEWEIPHLPTKYQSDKERAETEKTLKNLGIMQGSEAWKKIDEWWHLHRQRQQENDASIARRADTELLYDQPYEDNKRVRVTGPFTVESLSPHRVLSTEEERPRTEQEGQNQSAASGGFETLILDNLRVAGVENTKKAERLKFTRLEPYAGTWLQVTGEYQEKDGTARRVAVCIGPEHGTVSPDLIKDAAKEAVQGVGFDLLVVLGFAFDPHVSEEIHRYGKLTVLPARINPDLQMGNLLLKKSGVGNLFMVFAASSSIPNTTAKASLYAMPISPVPISRMTNSRAPCAPRWTRLPGTRFIRRHPIPMRTPRLVRSRSR